MNIYDIAEKAGVSIATVSRVLNGKENVSGKTREQVLRAIEECGYTPNVFARGLGLNTMKMVGIICSDVSDIYYATAVSILERELRRNGYDSILCCAGDNLEEKRKSLELLLQKRVDAIILVGSKFKERSDNSHLVQAAQEIPLILINGYVEAPNIYCVVCDDFNAMRKTALDFFDQGLSRLLYLYDSDSYSGVLKLEGYRRAYEERGFPPGLAFRCADSNAARETAYQFLGREPGIEAVLAANDLLAVGALKAALDLKKQVPGEVQVVGFNNSPYSLCSTPEISSVDNKVEILCVNAVRTLIDVFSHQNVSSHMVISAELVHRQTTTGPRRQ